MKRKKLTKMMIYVLLLSVTVVGCGKKESDRAFNPEKDITVVARDAASGTRGAFHEIMGIIHKEEDERTDNLAVGALEFDGSDRVITVVEGDKYGIGYISMGSVSDRIKTVTVDGVAPTVENALSGDYYVARPFLLVTKGKESALIRDFLDFAHSTQGQKIINDMRFIGTGDSSFDYTASGMSGIIKVAGSTSVYPLMEKLQEAYMNLNPDVKFEVQSNGSSQGIKSTIDGSYDIGMSSRELTEDEVSQLNRHVLAIDGIAVIVNNENPVENLNTQDITGIYTGEITKWSEVK